MTETELNQRRAVVEEALSWLKTPYHHEAHVKGHGVDCAHFLHEVYSAAGMIEWTEIPHYSPDWHLHRTEEKYLDFILGRAKPADLPYLPGDAVAYRWGRPQVSHAAIIIEWPDVIIHAFKDAGFVVLDSALTPALMKRQQGVYRLKVWE